MHDEAERTEDTDWPQILALYELLNRVSPGPMVTLNQGQSQPLWCTGLPKASNC